MPRTESDPATLTVAVTRLPVASPITGQVWMLQGGPGGSGESLLDAAAELQTSLPGFEVYLLDHRGTGRSTFLDCPALRASGGLQTARDLGPCANEAKQREGDLSAFGTRQTSLDLGALIELHRQPSRPVFVWGGSYGAYWAHRYLQLFPAQADGVVLDSGCIAEDCRLVETDRWLDDGTHAFLDACAADATCAAHGRGDPWTVAQGLSALVAGGHCAAAKLDPTSVRFTMSLLALEAPTLLVPFIDRLDRCDDHDVTALLHAQAVLTQRSDAGDTGFSPILQDTVVLSELWRATADDDAAATDAEATFSSGQAIRWASEWATWPRYSADRDASTWAQTKVPVLVIRGARDLRLPPMVTASAAAHLGVAHIVVGDAGHGVLFHSTCGTDIITSFLRDPHAQLDLACTTIPTDFVPDESLSLRVFGTTDAWDGAP